LAAAGLRMESHVSLNGVILIFTVALQIYNLVLQLMSAKKACIALITITIITACSSRKTDGDSFISRQQTDSCIRVQYIRNNYAAIDSMARKYINQEIGRHPKKAIEFAIAVYDTLQKNQQQRKDFALFLFSHRDEFKKDSSSLKIFFEFFGNRYADDYYVFTFDPKHINIAEYFIVLQKTNDWLNPDYLLYFKETLGIGYHVAGDLKKATAYYQDVLANDMKMDKAGDYANNICNSVYHICITLLENGLYDSIITYSDFFLKKYPFSKNKLAILHTIRAEAFLYLGDIQKANYSVNKVNTLLPQIADTDEYIKRFFEWAEIKSKIQYVTGNYRQGLVDIKEALTAGLIHEKNYRTRTIGKTLLQIGAVYKRLNQPDSALYFFHQALYTVAQVDSANIDDLPKEKNIYAENTMMDALDSLALMWDDQYKQTGDFKSIEQALQARELAFITERKLLAAFSYDESMKMQLLQSKKRSELAMQNCYTLWQKDHDAKWTQEALLVNENSKAIVLLHSVKRNQILNERQIEDSSITELSLIRYQLIMLERSLNEENTPRVKEKIQHELDSVNRNFLQLETTLQEKYPALKNSGVDTAILKLDSLRENILPKGYCLLQYFSCDTGIFITWVDSDSSGINFISKTAEQVISRYLNDGILKTDLFEKYRVQFYRIAVTCSNTVLPAACAGKISTEQYDHLIVLPDGIINQLPFEALVMNNQEFLIKKCQVNTGYSLSTLLQKRTGANRLSGLVAAFAPYTRNRFHQKPRLPFTKEEIAAVTAGNSLANIYEDSGATLKQFRGSLKNCSIIHIATHATLGDGGLPQIFFSDTVLYLPELYASQTFADLLVLSACETGNGEQDRNEGPLSLARGFYYAGAKNVINSLWRIDDHATADIFSNFYQNYAPGETGEKLRMAKLRFLDRQAGKYLAPYYWSGLVHTGLDDMPVKNRHMFLWMLFSAIPLTALLIFLNIRHRRRQAA
jgi:CHAT domain-containing protein